MEKERKTRKIVRNLLPNFWIYIFFSFVLSFTIQMIGLIPPMIMKNIIDNYIPNKNLSATLRSILWFSIIPLVMTLISTFYNYRLTISGRKIGQTISLLGFEKLIHQPISYFDDRNSVELASYCKTEAMKYVVFWIFDIPQLLSNILIGIILFTLISQVNIYIALGLLLYIPFLLIPSNIFAKKVQGYVNRIIENNAKANQVIADTFRGIRFVKTMLLEKVQFKKLQIINNNTVSIWSKTSALENLNGSWANSFVDSLFLGITFAVSSALIINEKMTIGLLVMLLSYTPKFFSAIKVISKTNFDFKRQLGEYDKLFEIILMDEEKDTYLGGKEFQFKNEIKFIDVEFKYSPGREKILKGLNFEINKGEWIGIVGSSGAGKTTIFDLLLMFYKIDNGTILIDGTDIYDFNINDIRKNITKVAQDTFLFPGTLRENLLLAKPNATDDELYEILEMVDMIDFVKNLGLSLDTEIGENGVQLSGGEQQRLGLAQGLLRNSKILLLDEVTANIDTLIERNIKNIIKRIIRERNLTVISISHRLNFLEYADRIIVIKNGRVLDEGEYMELKKRNNLFIETNN